MTGTQWVRDCRPPFGADDFPTITLSTTSLMLYPSATWAPTYATDWFTGKRFKLQCWGRLTTALTPGNLTIEIRYGTSDAGGTILATSAATALTASKTSISWQLETIIRCRDTNTTTGNNGSLIAMGNFAADGTGAVITSPGNPIFLPASVPAATAVDLSTTSGISIQMKRSGSTAETVIVHDLAFEALN